MNVSIVSAKSQIDEWQPRAERPLLPQKASKAAERRSEDRGGVCGDFWLSVDELSKLWCSMIDDRRIRIGQIEKQFTQCNAPQSAQRGVQNELRSGGEGEGRRFFGAVAVQFALMPRIKLAPASRTRQLPLLTLFCFCGRLFKICACKLRHKHKREATASGACELAEELGNL